MCATNDPVPSRVFTTSTTSLSCRGGVDMFDNLSAEKTSNNRHTVSSRRAAPAEKGHYHGTGLLRSKITYCKPSRVTRHIATATLGRIGHLSVTKPVSASSVRVSVAFVVSTISSIILYLYHLACVMWLL